MGTTRIKAIELVFDWHLWPRHSVNGLDGTNVARMREVREPYESEYLGKQHSA